MKKLLFVVLSLSFCALCHTGVAQHTFIKKVDNLLSLNSSVESISTSDGGALTATNAYAPISSIRIGVMITKFNSKGDYEWNKMYYSYAGDMISIGLAEGKDCYVIGGLLYDGAFNKQFLIKMDLTGSIEWAKTFAFSNASVSNSYDINIFSNGDIMFNNITHVSGTSGDGWVVMSRIDPKGNMVWTKHYQHTYKYGWSMITSDDHILMQHYPLLAIPELRNGITKTDGAGNILWSRDISETTESNKPIEINSKKLLIPVYVPTTKTFSLLCINDQGNILWNTEQFSGYPNKLMNTADGNVMVMSNNGSFFLFDQSGNFIKMNQVELPLPVSRSSVSEICGNQFLAFGESNTTLVFYKINHDLKSMCNDASTLTTLPPINHTNNPIAVPVAEMYYVSEDLFLFGVEGTFSSETVCENVECEKIDLGRDTILCGATSFVLNYTPGPLRCSVQRQFVWSTGETSPSIEINKNGTYWVEMNEDLCTSRDTITVIFDDSNLDLGEDSKLCTEKNESKELSAPGFVKYNWSNGETSSSIKVDKPGVYWVSARSVLGCDYIDTVIVEDECPPRFFIPQVFSPNGDGVNDELKPSGYFIDDFKLQVFNRWGRMVFESTSSASGWNGLVDNEPAPEGIYVWIVDYTGSYLNNSIKKSAKGTVVLIR